jgi:putative transposase
MEPRKFPNRRSIRLPQFDYSRDGVYFVTIDTFGKGLLFGNVINGEMILNEMGLIADMCWQQIPNHFTQAKLYDYIVMPNHVHGLIALLNDEKTDTAWRVPTVSVRNWESFSRPTSNSIPTIIRSYKSAVSRLIRMKFPVQGERIWQSRFFERVIRNERELKAAIDYIKCNPANWESKLAIDYIRK